MEKVAKFYFMSFNKNVMNINSLNKTSFGAIYISDTEVQKYNYIKEKFEPYKASFVQIDPNNKNDVIAVQNITDNWEDSLFTEVISKAVKKLRDGELENNIFKVYAITDDDILAIGEISQYAKKNIRLDYLQVNPDLNNYEQKSFKNTGSAFLNMLKSLKGIKSIILTSLYTTMDFYEKNGFTMIDPYNLIFRWKSKGKL